MYVENRTKIANFPTPVYLTPPMKGFHVEFGIGVRGPKCLNDGPTRWSKKFSDRFSHFDTIPAETDSHPASHVAIAITLNAKASSLKSGQYVLRLGVLGKFRQIYEAECIFYHSVTTCIFDVSAV